MLRTAVEQALSTPVEIVGVVALRVVVNIGAGEYDGTTADKAPRLILQSRLNPSDCNAIYANQRIGSAVTSRAGARLAPASPIACLAGFQEFGRAV